MSLFSINNILLNEENKNIDIDDIECLDTDIKNYSFVQEGYNFIINTRKEYMIAEQIFYTNILDSYGNNEIITESYKNLSNKVKDVIKKFIEWVKQIFNKFVLKLKAFYNNSDIKRKIDAKTIKKIEKEGFKPFKFNGYEFTLNNINTDTNDLQLDNLGQNIKDFEYKANQLLANQNSEQTIETLAKVKKLYEEIYHHTLEIKTENIDIIRGKIINLNKKITSSEYANILFSYFRNNEIEPKDIIINKQRFLKSYNNLTDSENIIKQIKNTSKSIEEMYKNLLNRNDNELNLTINKQLNLNNQIQTQNDSYTKQMSKSIFDINQYKMSILQAYNTIITEISNIHAQAFTALLQAAKDCVLQDQKIVKAVILNFKK